MKQRESYWADRWKHAHTHWPEQTFKKQIYPFSNNSRAKTTMIIFLPLAVKRKWLTSAHNLLTHKQGKKGKKEGRLRCNEERENKMKTTKSTWLRWADKAESGRRRLWVLKKLSWMSKRRSKVIKIKRVSQSRRQAAKPWIPWRSHWSEPTTTK